ncbi:hypothetical protein LCGC14_0371080 [marine sediment metagenome]|uniref:DUF1376 domain-containing protein n=1 Tax=marine sediment metagenome TaxID=412755 RepID=A0A0F9TNB3_9ZZZZ|nr:DUF1376 domain-containing protein [Maribacter sp.]HDZ04864.1 DUF1376 domain-containing protein [Maribacter sp.]
MKDPAALVYIDKWISATKGMKGAEKGWYFDLILHQFDKGSIPSDLDELASICAVRPSEYKLFEQVFEQVLKQKFELNDEQRYENGFAKEIIQRRQKFVEKRSSAGKISYIMRYARKNFKLNKKKELFLKEKIDLTIDLKNEQVLKHMLEQKLELYINVDEDVNKDNIKKGVNLFFNTETFKSKWKDWREYKNDEFEFKYKSKQSEQATLTELYNLSGEKESIAVKIIDRSMAKGWKGFFKLNDENNKQPKPKVKLR